ncbi:uncharacterized protein ISCGN_017409 [Ixodes scapularis]
MNHDITHLSFCIDEDDDEVIINENKLKASAVSYVIRRIRAGVSEPEDNGGEVCVGGDATENLARKKEKPYSPKETSCLVSKDDSRGSLDLFEDCETAEVATHPTPDQTDRQDPSVDCSTLACSPKKQEALEDRTSQGEQTTSGPPQPPCSQTVPPAKVPTLEEISLGTLFCRNIDLARDEEIQQEQPVVSLNEDKSGSASFLEDPSREVKAHQWIEQSCQTSFCYAEPPAQTSAPSPGSTRKVAMSASPRRFARTPTLRSPFGPVENLPCSEGGAASPRRRPLPGSSPSWIPARGAVKARGSPRQTAKSKESPSPFKLPCNRTPSSVPRSAGRINSPWAVESPVARYIHEKPAPPLVQIVKPKKSPSAKSLCAIASARVTTARSRVPMTPLSAKKYQSSNMGILSKAGVNQYGPLEPFVIKHTVPEASQCETASGIEASVIQVIRK